MTSRERRQAREAENADRHFRFLRDEMLDLLDGHIAARTTILPILESQIADLQAHIAAYQHKELCALLIRIRTEVTLKRPHNWALAIAYSMFAFTSMFAAGIAVAYALS